MTARTRAVFRCAVPSLKMLFREVERFPSVRRNNVDTYDDMDNSRLGLLVIQGNLMLYYMRLQFSYYSSVSKSVYLSDRSILAF